MNVLIAHLVRFSLWRAPEWLSVRLAADFPEHEFVQIKSYEELPERLPEADVFVGMSLKPEQFAAARRLKWIHSPAAAVHQLLFPALIESDVMVTNSASVHGPVVAEHAIAQVLALARALHIAMRYQQKHVWAQEQMWNEHENARPREVAGATLLVVGLGHIGSAIAGHARALGMRVLATRGHPERGGGAAHEVFGSERLLELLPRADFVVIAAPVTGSTKALLDAEALGRMKPTAYVINVGRGALVDENALIEALKSWRIAGAALDVFVQEPLPTDSPLWGLENVLLTPHIAGLTENAWQRHYELIRENFGRFIRGEPLLGLVDKQRGY
ncbi:MAG: D-2-hydroxyacid dehydrogenase [Acidobacteriaceae bacterium]